MLLFEKSGYLNIPEIVNQPYTFIFVIGGRGTGKTYGALKYIYEQGLTAIILRQTQVQADIISNPAFHPYKKYSMDTGIEFDIRSVTKGVSGIYSNDRTIGYIAALSTFANLRGFDASDVDMIYYDEFIPENGKKSLIKNEYKTFLNMYETVNRNRELIGDKPVKVLCCANANTLDNPYFTGLGIINKIYSMQEKGKSIYSDKDRGLLVISLSGSPISEAKKETALYKLAGTGTYTDMAINNIYTGSSGERIRKQNLVEYRPIVGIGEITIYKHKSETRYYVTLHRRGEMEIYTSSEDDIDRFKIHYGVLLLTAYYNDVIFYEDKNSEILFKTYVL